MGAELLGGVSGVRDPGRWSGRRLRLLPLSVAVHAAAVGAVIIVPLAAEVDPPVPHQAPRVLLHVMPVVPPPATVLRAPASVPAPTRASTDAAPREAPPTIEPEQPAEPADPAAVVEGAIPLGESGPGGLPGAGAGIPLAPPPAPAPPVRPLRISDGIRPPQKVVEVLPVYPSIARQARVEGMVILEAVIDERGHVEQLRVLRSVPLLDEAAIQAVRQWKYAPTLLNGVPVPVLMTVSVHFRLHE